MLVDFNKNFVGREKKETQDKLNKILATFLDEDSKNIPPRTAAFWVDKLDEEGIIEIDKGQYDLLFNFIETYHAIQGRPISLYMSTRLKENFLSILSDSKHAEENKKLPEIEHKPLDQ